MTNETTRENIPGRIFGTAYVVRGSWSDYFEARLAALRLRRYWR
jgi:hypothetical protein